MKAYYKSELAMMAGVSTQTLYRWLKRNRDVLIGMGVNPKAKLLPPIAVKYICDNFGITIDESVFSR